jgi:hypothetical protein
MDLHLSVSGALTGEMLIAAILDAFPQHEERVVHAIDAVDAAHPLACVLLAHSEAGISGRRFEIVPFERHFGHIPFAFSRTRPSWESVIEGLDASQIRRTVRTHATRICQLLAAAESKPTGANATGAADSTSWSAIAEIVGMAALIDALGPVRWKIAPLPFGAAAPTAAAILAYVCPPRVRGRPLPRMRTPALSGTGFGSPPAADSYLRLLCYDGASREFAAPDLSTQVAPPAAGGRGQRPAP